MKQIFYALTLVILGSFLLPSCGGGWTDESKERIKNTCSDLMKITYSEEDAGKICDCYLEGLVKDFPKSNFKPEEAQKILEGCSGGYKSNLEEQVSDAISTDTSGVAMDTTAPAQ